MMYPRWCIPSSQLTRIPFEDYPHILGLFIDTMNYPKKTGFNLYESRHCAYITYSVKTCFYLSVPYGSELALFEKAPKATLWKFICSRHKFD